MPNRTPANVRYFGPIGFSVAPNNGRVPTILPGITTFKDTGFRGVKADILGVTLAVSWRKRAMQASHLDAQRARESARHGYIQ
jgi:hypothetical protein